MRLPNQDVRQTHEELRGTYGETDRRAHMEKRVDNLASQITELILLMRRNAGDKQPSIARDDRGMSSDRNQEARNGRWKGDEDGRDHSSALKKGGDCAYCYKYGHDEDYCWKKHGTKPFANIVQSETMTKTTAGSRNGTIRSVPTDQITLIS